MALTATTTRDAFVKPRRHLEIRTDTGRAFHQPPLGQWGPHNPAPKQTMHCDCEGIGVECHQITHDDQHFTVHGPHVMVEHHLDFTQRHKGPRCKLRRQFYVDVTDRPDAKNGMKYDEKTDSFFPE